MLLQVSNLNKAFGGLQALNGVSFEVADGEIVGLIGPNGSGKSTLFNVITGFMPADSGNVIFRGEDITRLPAHETSRRGMGRTFQLVRPFLHLSALQNVMVGSLYGSSAINSPTVAETRAREILAELKLAPKADGLARDLTIMERKWLEVARALATEPKLLLLDEFMAGLNQREVQMAIELVMQLRERGLTIIVVEHIVKAITNVSDRVIVLNAGGKIAEGTPAEIIENPQVIQAYLGSAYAKTR